MNVDGWKVLMAWNEPGNSGDRDPWGNRDGAPPDLDEVLGNLKKKFGGVFKGGSGSDQQTPAGVPGSVVFIGLIVLFIGWLLTGFYRITEGYQGVVLRFGEFQTTANPGLHWHIPRPIEKVEKVDIGRLRAVEIGYRENQRSGQLSSVPFESLMLTQDENIIDIKFAVQYQVNDARAFLFNVRDPEGTLQQVAESAIRQQVGQTPMDSILSRNRNQVSVAIFETMQEVLDRYESGLRLSSVNMQDAQPPEQVQAAFADAVKAREDKQRLINEAEAYRNDILPRANGEAARILADADAYRATLMARANGVAQRFTALREAYAEAPDVTRKRLYLETMEEVLAANRKVMIEGDASNNLLYLPLDRMVNEFGNRSTGELSGEPATSSSRVPVEQVDSRSVRRGRESRL